MIHHNNDKWNIKLCSWLSVGLRGYADRWKVLQVEQQNVIQAMTLFSKYGHTLNAQQIYLHILEESLWEQNNAPFVLPSIDEQNIKYISGFN